MTNTKVETKFRRLEANELEAIKSNETNLRVAMESHSLIESELASAKDALTVIEGSFSSLSDTHSAEDYVLASAEVHRSTLRLSGSKAAIAAAERKRRHADTEIAQVVANVLTRAYPDIPVVATFLAPSGSVDAPALVVSQADRTKAFDDGTIQGVVNVSYFRSNVYQPLSVRTITDAAGDMDIALEVIGGRVDTDNDVDRVRIKVHQSFLTLPVIPSINADDAPKSICRTIAGGVADRVRNVGVRPRFDHYAGAYLTDYVTVLPGSGCIVAEGIAEDGSRTLTVDADCMVRVDNPPNRPVTEQIDQALGDLKVGRFYPGLGVLTDIERVHDSELAMSDLDVEQALSDIDPSDTGTDATTFGFRTVHQVIVRATFASKVG